MKTVRHILLASGIVLGLTPAFSSLCGQGVTTPGTRGRIDPVQRELQRRFESEALERALVGNPGSRTGVDRRMMLAQIREDFLQLQIINDDLQKLTSRPGSLDLTPVAKWAAEITKRSERLRDNLSLPAIETSSELPAARPEMGIELLRAAVRELSKAINGFVENPIFEKSRVVDAKLSAQALSDLEEIIRISKQVKRNTQQLKRAGSPTTSRESRVVPAFPGAEGFGSTTPGGRGGRVIMVTNLNDSGPGSFRAACDAEGPRIVIFRVSGTITLATPLAIKNPYLTIAGQTAPGDGICIRNHSFIIATHDVVVRYLRSRLGDLSGQEADSITLASGAANVILDHCSASWSIDEALSLAGNVSNITVQWCLIAEGLNRSKHTKGAHGYGSLSRANGPVTWHHNLWAHNNSRNPRLGDNYGRPPYPTFDVRNNVIYNYGEIASGLTQGVLKVNYVANYIRPGPASKAGTPIRVGGPSDLTFYIRANVFEGNRALTADNSQFFYPVRIDGQTQVQIVAQPFKVEPVLTTNAADAYRTVLRMAGASLPRRDAVDTRIVKEVRRRQGSIIDSQDQVGGWPALASKTAPLDSDGDGLPDSWERRQGLNPHDPADGSADKNKDGYTNLEEYLNSFSANR